MSRFTIDWSELSLQAIITFGHFLWQACAVAIVLAMVEQLSSVVSRAGVSGRTRALRSEAPDSLRRSANLRYTVACLAFFALPVCVVATFGWVHHSRGPILLAASESVELPTNPVEIAHESASPVASTDSPLLQPRVIPANTAIAVTVPLEAPTPFAPARSWAEQFQSFAPFLLIAYAIGVGLMLARFSLSIVGSSRLRQSLQPITDSDFLKIVAEQSSRLGLKRVPIVALCRRVTVPVVVGILKPAILLPPALLCGLDPNQLAAILSHEMAHIRRYDLLVNLLQRIVEALLFFHPVTWWISRRVSIERENCCDDMAAAGCGRFEYAAALLRMAEQCARARGLKIAAQLASLAADGGSTSQLGYRVNRLLGEEYTPRVSLTRNAIAAIVLAVVIGGLSMIAVAQSGGDDPAESPSASANRGAWGDESYGLRCRIVPVSPAMDTEHIDMGASVNGFISPDEITFAVELKNVSDKPITFVSETGRQGDVLQIRNAKGKDVNVKDAYFTGDPIDVHWTLQPGDIAELDVLTPSLNQGLSPGEYSVRYTIRFNSRQLTDKDGNQTFPAPGDYDSEIDTGWTPLLLRDPNQPALDDATSKPTRGCQFKLVDGETGNPLQGLECKASIFKEGTPPKLRSCKSGERGIVDVEVADGEGAWIAEVPSGWFTSAPSVTVFELDKNGKPKHEQTAVNKEEPTVVKLWRGEEVIGRLLWPDKTPAAGVQLTAGVYINQQTWKQQLGMDLRFLSFDHGDWPNWSRTVVTDDAGRFQVTVPPQAARWWLRIGTSALGFGPQIGVGENEAVTQRLAKCMPLEFQYGGKVGHNILTVPADSDAGDAVLRSGDLQLETGVIVRGRVVDAEGNGLSKVFLTTTGPHGPHSGRKTISGDDGRFEFPAMAAGNLTVHSDARLRDGKEQLPGTANSREVQAVFIDQSFTIPESDKPHEITIRAVPHTEVTFEWIDRRADKTQPIAFYGAFRVRGYMPDDDGKPSTYWTGETERTDRNGKPWLTIKIPTQLLKPELMLFADRKVTASYSDSTGVASGPGVVQLGDITIHITRTIFGDEPDAK